MSDSAKRLYEWDVAEVGHRRDAVSFPVKKERIDLYVKGSGDANPLFTDEAFAQSQGLTTVAVPVNMTLRVAHHHREQIIEQNGYVEPERSTPFSRWECKLFTAMKPGDIITSTARLAEKFEKRGRRYFVWEVTAQNQHGEKVALYRTTNCWDGTKPEDKTR